MDKQLASDSEKTEYTLSIRVEPMSHPRHEGISGYGVVIVGADGKEKAHSNFIHRTQIDALESGIYLLKVELNKLLIAVQELDNG